MDHNDSENAGPFPVPHATIPYWRSQLHPIDEYRTPGELPVECDVAIIGAGLSGVATAYHLSQLSGRTLPSIVMLEARQVCSGATGRNGGHVKTKINTAWSIIDKFGLPAASSFMAMIHRIKYDLKRVVEKENLDCEFELRRTLDVFLDAGEADIVERQWYQSLDAEEEWTREVDLVLKSHVEQVTSIKETKIAYSGPACSLWPYKFVTQLLAKLVERDVLDLHTNTPVLEISHNTDSTTSLHTDRGTLRAGKVVFATNGYTSGLLKHFRNALVPTKITATHISPSNPLFLPHLSNTYNISYTNAHAPSGKHAGSRVDYLNPRPDGTIVVGGGNWTYKTDTNKHIWWNNWDDSTLHPGTATREHFDQLMPTHFRGWEESGARVDSMWTGITGTTVNGVPFVGKVSSMSDAEVGAQGFVLAGYNGGGMSMIWPCAEAIAKMVYHGIAFEETGLPGFMNAAREMKVF